MMEIIGILLKFALVGVLLWNGWRAVRYLQREKAREGTAAPPEVPADFAVADGERVLKSAPCTDLERGWWGMLILTDRRLHYTGVGLFARHPFDLPLADIATVELALGWPIPFANSIRVVTRHGQAFRLQPHRRAEWPGAILAAKRQAEAEEAQQTLRETLPPVVDVRKGTTMTLKFLCPHCEAQITAPITAAGKDGPCPRCHASVTAPEAPSTVPPPQLHPCLECGRDIPMTEDVCTACRERKLSAAATNSSAISPSKPSKWRNPWVVAAAVVGLLLFVFMTLRDCGAAQGDKMLTELSGVWKCASEDTLVTIDLLGDHQTVTIGEDTYAVKVVEIDRTSDRLTLDAGEGGEEKLWTIRQDWNEEHKRFTLHITMQTGWSDDLEFVRNL